MNEPMEKHTTQEFNISLIGIPINSDLEYPYRNEITIIAKTAMDMNTELNEKFTRISNILIREVKRISTKPTRKNLGKAQRRVL